MIDKLAPAPKYDNKNIMAALTKQGLEVGPRVIIKKEGRELGFSDLMKMKLGDILESDMKFFGMRGKFIVEASRRRDLMREDREAVKDRTKKYNFYFDHGCTEAGMGLTIDEPALRALQQAYEASMVSVLGRM